MTGAGPEGRLVRPMSTKLVTIVLTGVFFFAPPPAQARVDSTGVQLAETVTGSETAALDKEKPSKPERREKEKKGGKEKKKYDDFIDKNHNGIDDRYEKKEPSKEPKEQSDDTGS